MNLNYSKSKTISFKSLVFLLLLCLFLSFTSNIYMSKSNAVVSKNYIVDNFPHYPSGTFTFSSEGNTDYKSENFKNYVPNDYITGSLKKNPNNFFYLDMLENKNYTFKKKNLNIQNIKNGNPLALKCDVVLNFTLVEKNENKKSFLIIDKKNVVNTFYIYNIKKLKCDISFNVNGSSLSEIYHFSLGFTDIDNNQTCYIKKSDLSSINQAFNQKYFKGQYLKESQNDEYYKLSGTKDDSSTDNSLALFGINKRSNEKTSLIFETNSEGITLFQGKYMMNKGKSTAINPTLNYILPTLPSLRHFTDSNKLKINTFSTFSSIKDNSLIYGKTYSKKEIKISDAYNEIKNKSGNVVGLTYSSFDFKSSNSWYNETNLQTKTFNSNNLIYVYWENEKKIYPKLSETKVSLPQINITDINGNVDQNSVTKFKTNTDVIFSVRLNELGGNDVTLEGITLTFKALGNTFCVKNIVIPKGKSQIVFIKFNTGKEELSDEIIVYGSYKFRFKTYEKEISIDKKSFIVNIKHPDEILPPNPKENDLMPKNFDDNFHSLLKNTETKKEWEIYTFTNEKFSLNKYSLSFDTISAVIMPNKYVKSDRKTGAIKAGYGIDIVVKVKLKLTVNNETFYLDKTLNNLKENNPNYIAVKNYYYSITPAQRINFLFPEFNYKKYNRLSMPLERIDLSEILSEKTFHFKQNKDSLKNEFVHFTPLWYPDSKYTVLLNIGEIWTPLGELKNTISSNINIKEDLFKDYYIKEIR